MSVLWKQQNTFLLPGTIIRWLSSPLIVYAQVHGKGNLVCFGHVWYSQLASIWGGGALMYVDRVTMETMWLLYKRYINFHKTSDDILWLVVGTESVAFCWRGRGPKKGIFRASTPISEFLYDYYLYFVMYICVHFIEFIHIYVEK